MSADCNSADAARSLGADPKRGLERGTRVLQLPSAKADTGPARGRTNPKDLVDALHQTARLQTVKCVPRRKNSSPIEAMKRACADLLLEAELAILRPRHILALGNVADESIAALPDYAFNPGKGAEYFWRYEIRRTGGSGPAAVTDVWALRHARGVWDRGHSELIAYLQSR